MLQEATQIGMMDGLCGRGALEEIHEGFIGEEGLSQGTQVGVIHRSQDRYQLRSHRFGIVGTLRQKIFRGYTFLIQARNILHPNLDLALIKGRQPAYPHKVVFLKSPPQVICPLPHPPFDFTASICQLQSQIAAAAFGHPVVLGGYQKGRINLLVLADIRDEKRLHKN